MGTENGLFNLESLPDSLGRNNWSLLDFPNEICVLRKASGVAPTEWQGSRTNDQEIKRPKGSEFLFFHSKFMVEDEFLIALCMLSKTAWSLVSKFVVSPLLLL